MRVWVFNEEQLAAALTQWMQTRSRLDGSPDVVVDYEVDAVRRFLNSDAVREHKLMMVAMMVAKL